MRRFLFFCALAACIAVGAANGKIQRDHALSLAAGAPAGGQPQSGGLLFKLLANGSGHGEGKVTDNGRNGCHISLTNRDKNNYVIALCWLNKRAAAQQKLAFRLKGKATNGTAKLTVTLAAGSKFEAKTKELGSVKNVEFKSVVLALDSDFGFADAAYDLKQLKFILNGVSNPIGTKAEVEIEDVRIVGSDEVSGSGTTFHIVPFQKEQESRAVSGVTPVKVYFDFDNDDLSAPLKSRVSVYKGADKEDTVPTKGFRSRLLAGAEGIVELVSTPEEADVLVYSRAASGSPGALLSALESGKRLIVYGKPADPELEAKLPLSLNPRELDGFAKREKLRKVAEHPLFSGQTLIGGDFGCYFKSSLRNGKAILSFEDGSPFLAEDGKILHFASGVGTALLPGDVFYDKLFLRAVTLGSKEALSALEAREKELLERRSNEDAAYVKSVLDSAGIEAGTLHYLPGMSRDNMGRFGWLIGEGLSCGDISRDLTVTNGVQSYRIDAASAGKGDGRSELAVSSINWTGKTYRITLNGQTRELQMTLLAPFIRYTFPEQSEVFLSLENIADYAAWSTPKGIQIVDLRKTPDFFDQKRDGNWKEPWLLLFRETAGNPLLLVFEKQPGSVRAQVRGSVLDGIRISREGKVGIVAAGWPWGITPPETATWSKLLPSEALSQIKLGVNMALNFPVGCDEVFAIDSQKKRVEIVSAFRFSPAKDDWNTKLEPFATLPPLASFALQQKKLVATQNDVTNFKINTLLGPTIGKSNSAAIRYSLPLPPEEDLILPGIKNSGQAGNDWNEIFASAVQYSCGGLVPVTAWSAAQPGGKDFPETHNIDPFSWNFGMTTALQGGLLLDEVNRQKLENRCRLRFIEPIELYQYKNFARHRKEPFSGLEYPISFNSFYPITMNYAPGMGSKIVYGDANEACTVMVWVGEQLADIYGHAGLIRGNWSFFKEVMRQNLFIDDYAFHASSCREFGVGAWVDMLNGEYAGMLYYARLAAIVGDKETEAQAIYRAAKRMLPTIMRLYFKRYMTEVNMMPGIEKDPKTIVSGFGENGVKTLPLSPSNGNFISAMDLFDFSQGSPGVLYRLYKKEALPAIQAHLSTALPILNNTKDNLKDFKLGSAYLQPFAMYTKDPSALERARQNVVKKSGAGRKKDWPGICVPFHFGCVLWRKDNIPAFSECRELDIRKAEYAGKKLIVNLKAVPQSRLVVDRAPKRVWRGETLVTAEKTASGSGFSLPLAEGENKLIIEF